VATTDHRPFKVTAFNAIHKDVALLSETHLKPHERFFIPNYHFYRTTSHEEEAELPLKLEKAFPVTMQTCLHLFQ
jgi:hypothetical protein